MWGQAVIYRELKDLRGIIPTRVGTSLFLSRAVRSSEDHPHACGDKLRSCGYSMGNRGSSPRVWGQGYLRTAENLSIGIIPTRVGTSAKNALLLLTLRDHPYACGDKQGISAHTQARHGSSPRVWGQAEKMNLKNLQKRIIPTRVGTSLLVR